MEFLQGIESFLTRGSSAILHSPRTWDNIRLCSRSWWSCMFSVGVGSWFSKLLESESDFQKVASWSRFLNSNNLWDGVGILKNLPTPQRWKWLQTRIKALSEVKIYIYTYIPILPALVRLCLVRLVYFIFIFKIFYFSCIFHYAKIR